MNSQHTDFLLSVLKSVLCVCRNFLKAVISDTWSLPDPLKRACSLFRAFKGKKKTFSQVLVDGVTCQSGTGVGAGLNTAGDFYVSMNIWKFLVS